jgi:hypothetical protein
MREALLAELFKLRPLFIAVHHVSENVMFPTPRFDPFILGHI